MDALDVPIIVMSPGHPSNPVEHFPELCTTCAARMKRHEPRSSSVSSEESSINAYPQLDSFNLEAQLATAESESTPPPPYNRRRRYQRLDVEPPAYSVIVTIPPPGVQTTTIPVTVRYTETLILEDDGYSKVICPTARKFKTSIKVYDSMDWDRFWQCLRQTKPCVTKCRDGLKDVRILRRMGRWEKFAFAARMSSLKLSEANWEEVRGAICKGQMHKVVVYV